MAQNSDTIIIPSNFKQLYIGFAGPYPASPSSAFGHSLLLVEPNNSEETTLQLWPAVNYAGNVDSLSGVPILYRGALGKLTGSYEILPFYKIIEDYSYSESRDIWLFPIQLTDTEKQRFANFVNSKGGLESQYRFMDKNCATRIYETLYTIFEEEPHPGIFVLPQQVIEDDLIASKIGEPFWIENLESQIVRLYEKYGHIEESNEAIDSLSNSEKLQFLRTYEWIYNNRSMSFNAEKLAFIQSLRYQVSKEKSISDVQLLNLQSKPFNIHYPARASFGVAYDDLYKSSLNLGFRIGLHEFEDTYDTYPQFDYISLVSVDALINHNRLYFNEFWLFNQISRQPKSELDTPKSWTLGFGGKRFYFDQANVFTLGVFTGLGLSHPIVSDSWYNTLILNAYPVFIPQNGFALILEPKLEQRIYLSSKTRFLVTLSNPIKKFNRNWYNPNASLKFVQNLNQNLNFVADLTSNERFHHIQMGLKVNFGY